MNFSHFVRIDREGRGLERHFVVHTLDPKFTLELTADREAPDQVGRAQGLVLLAVSAIGYALRSASGLKWVLVILTFEGSIRIGMLVSLFAGTWRRLAQG